MSTPSTTERRSEKKTASNSAALPDIAAYCPPHTRELGAKVANVLLVGAVGVGKSSFVNAVLTALERVSVRRSVRSTHSLNGFVFGSGVVWPCARLLAVVEKQAT